MSSSTATATGSSGQMQSNQDSQLFIDEALHKNFTYIYAILVTLLVLLVFAFFGILYLYIRRRRRHIHRRLLRATSPTAEEDSSSNDAQRRKKHKLRGKKPKLASAWIGNGPLPISLSTEALLEVIQPFSLSKVDEKQVGKSALSSPSMTSLPSQDEKAASIPDLSDPQRPHIHDMQLLNAGFLIAMPVPRSTSTLRGSPSSLSLAHSSEGSCESDSISLADSRWTDRLCHGELPELTLGISTISVLPSSMPRTS